ncbi:hypothetical protein [Nocardiopsis composta]|uniref:Uncharacterized protein n=1 Tax=Nocardiopsis composta TaxID=157465 RepID=A0A7W8VGG3_9ACTN|nr:hypothetical protein [Nocardiopsis composta]MBB5435145.1 hypothetical protein [Nocardiopsis composta]
MGLDDDPFDYQITKSGKVLVSRGGRRVATIAGAEAARLIGRLGHDDESDQHLLARATGNYRQGNERRPHR